MTIFQKILKLQRQMRIISLENQILYDTALAIHTSTSLSDLLDTFLGRMRTHLGGDFAYVCMLEGGSLHIEKTNSFEKSSLQKSSFRVGEGLVGESLLKDHPIITGDVSKDPRYIKVFDECKSQLTIPLKIYNQKIGVLVLGSFKKNQFKNKDLLLLKTISSEIAIAINSAKLTEELRSEKDQIHTLYSSAQEITSSIDISEVMETGINTITDFSDAINCSLMLYDEDEKVLKIKAARGLAQESIDQVKLKIGEGIAGKAFEQNRSMVTENGDDDLQFQRIPGQRERFQSMYSIPLLTKKGCIGVINISTNEPLLAQKYKLIETITSQLAKALENAIIHHSVEVLATTDNLTGFYNNRYFYEALEREIIKSQKNKTQLTLVTLDIDDFKIFNDRYGHLIGDYVLKEISNIIHKGTRESDILCRYGGDELFIILPETDAKSAAILMKRIVENIEKHSVEMDQEIGLETNEKNQMSPLGLGHVKSWLSSKFNTKEKLTGNIQVTVSVGICSIENIDAKYRNDNQCIKKQLIKKADKAMLSAKHKGKNQVVNA